MKSLAVREDFDIATEAAEAQVDVGEFDAALPLLQTVSASRPEDPTALSLLARTLAGLGAKDKARQVWLVVAQLHGAAGRAPERAEALAAALEAGADDPALKSEVATA
jgi:predicted Zn-dependent protease